MTQDKFYKAQLEKFGTESTQIVRAKKSNAEREHSIQVTRNVVGDIMSTMEGRQWLYSKLDLCAVFTSPFVPNDPHGTSYLSGAQTIGQNILNDIMVSAPNKFMEMVSEADARRSSAKAGKPTDSENE